jgi:hypothetical protein
MNPSQDIQHKFILINNAQDPELPIQGNHHITTFPRHNLEIQRTSRDISRL